jgi:hypothetical protein
MKSLEDILALLDEYKVLLRHDGAVGAGHLAQMCEKIGRTLVKQLGYGVLHV